MRESEPVSWRLTLGKRQALDLVAGRPKVMGVVNVTPDSFSDGGRFLAPNQAVEHGLRLLEEGADLLDLGAESTRPGGGVYGAGAREVSIPEEIDRLAPVIESLRQETDKPISVDTRKGPVARTALAAGADLINDVGMLRDDELMAAVAAAGCPVIIMHSRGDIATMQRTITFENVAIEVTADLADALARARQAGIAPNQVILDPGIGFGKTASQNLELLCHTEPLRALGRPLLIGASRKSFIAATHPAPPERRLGGSLAAAGWASRRGAALLRVHDVAATLQYLELSKAIAAVDPAAN